MQRRIPWPTLAIWIFASTVAVLACCVSLQSARLNGGYLPVGNDSFYHARRILDTARDPSSFYEFDTHIHAPEGSLLTWPWGYDYAMGWMVRIGMKLGLAQDPMSILAWIPVASVLLSVWLIILVARRLELSYAPTILAALCLALSPTTQLLHGVGQIDHHYVEFIFVLATLAGGLQWLKHPDDTQAAVTLGAILGVAPAIHNGLFILQLPFLIALFAFWLQGRSMSRKASAWFGATLVATTLAILIPSLPFRQGAFDFYTLCWFHLYIAACTSATVAFFSRVAMTRNAIFVLAGAAVALVLPILHQLSLAQGFLSGTNPRLNAIGEMIPPGRLLLQRGTMDIVTHIYSHLIWLTPLTVVLCLIYCWRDRASYRLFLWISALCGLALLSLQLRMQYFGSFALYLPWLVVVQDYARIRTAATKVLFLLTSMALLLLYYPALRHQLLTPMPRANDTEFDTTYPLLVTLHNECAKDPGIVLADANAGHYIRYFTDCSVIADNFLLTPQHVQKVAETDRMFGMSVAEFPAAAPQVKYVFVRPLNVTRAADGSLEYHAFNNAAARLPSDLLLSTEP